MGTPKDIIQLTPQQLQESLQDFNKAVDDAKKDKMIRTMSLEIKVLRNALKEHMSLNDDEELESWLIDYGYKEQ